MELTLRQATCSGDFNFTEVTKNKLTISLFDVEVVKHKINLLQNTTPVFI